MPSPILLIDNYDSFTYNLVQAVGALGGEVEVRRNDAVSLDAIAAMAPRALILSPGPGEPGSAGITLAAIARFAGTIPMLGVCLGHQAIAQAFGGEVVRADRIVHGKSALVHHRGEALFRGLTEPFAAARYHSLVVRRESLPACLEVTAWTAEGEIMALRHRDHPVAGVQFHPESILTPEGPRLLQNFLEDLAAAG